MIKNALKAILHRVDPNGRVRRLRGPIVRRFRFIGSEVVAAARGNDLIAGLIESRTPAAGGKIGNSELRAVRATEAAVAGKRQIEPAVLDELHVGPGVFPRDSATATRWVGSWVGTLGSIDLFGVWFITGEDRLIRREAPRAKLADYLCLEPYRHERPWSRHLAGRRVVVVSPFATSIEEQYRSRRGLIWGDRGDILPAFDLRVVRMPLSPALVAPDERDYFVRLALVQAAMLAEPFDVAIIGAGAMSLPLCVAAKRAGAIGLHLGGATQILFGIRGARWDNKQDFTAYFNEHWTRPLPSETPAKAALVENACYW